MYEVIVYHGWTPYRISRNLPPDCLDTAVRYSRPCVASISAILPPLEYRRKIVSIGIYVGLFRLIARKEAIGFSVVVPSATSMIRFLFFSERLNCFNASMTGLLTYVFTPNFCVIAKLIADAFLPVMETTRFFHLITSS